MLRSGAGARTECGGLRARVDWQIHWQDPVMTQARPTTVLVRMLLCSRSGVSGYRCIVREIGSSVRGGQAAFGSRSSAVNVARPSGNRASAPAACGPRSADHAS